MSHRTSCSLGRGGNWGGGFLVYHKCIGRCFCVVRRTTGGVGVEGGLRRVHGFVGFSAGVRGGWVRVSVLMLVSSTTFVVFCFVERAPWSEFLYGWAAERFAVVSGFQQVSCIRRYDDGECIDREFHAGVTASGG